MTTDPISRAMAIVMASQRDPDAEEAEQTIERLLRCPDLLIDLACEAARRSNPT